MKIKRLSFLLVLIFTLTSCHSSSPSTYQPYTEDLVLSIDRTDLRAFTLSPGGDLFAIPEGGVLTRFTHDGEETEKYPGTEGFYALSADNAFVYAYDVIQSRFVKMACDSGTIIHLGDVFALEEIKNLIAVENTLYALVIEDFDNDYDHGYSVYANGYMDFHEKLYAININNGKMTEINIEHIMAIYAGSDSMLYYYAYTDNEYGLYRYKNGRSEKVQSLSNTGYLYAFIYENNQFIYHSLIDSSVRIRDCSDGSETTIYNNFGLYAAFDMQFHLKRVVLLRVYPMNNINDSTVRELFMFNLERPLEGPDSAGYPPEKISIYAINNQSDNWLINTSVVHKRSNITANYFIPPLDNMEQLAQLMAGDPDVDIYIFRTTYLHTWPIFNMGMYTPLTGSEIIRRYLDNCFDYIAKGAQTDSGEIWMLPLYADANVLWYVPENFERFGLTPGDVRYFDGFVETVKRLNAESREYAVYVDYPSFLWYGSKMQYNITYNNFIEKKADYNTELFMDIFTTMWGGWHRYDNERHPLFRNSYSEWDGISLVNEMPNYNKNKVIFKYDSVHMHLSAIKDPLNGWRALPSPRISADVQGNIYGCTYAIVNPLSKKKETAIRFLETIAQDPFATIIMEHFLYKDPEAYHNKYDISLLGFQDLFSIFRDGEIHFDAVHPDQYEAYVDDYQAGRLTAEEAIMTLQREVEIWLNE
jgi:ABC-type glycerol-3-phosphate transport system substrate-binding protein